MWLNLIWSELSTSENQSNWFDYAESHLAHIALGFLSVACLSAAWFGGVGEFPHKAVMAVILLAFWFFYEHISQGWGDVIGNLEDLAFLYVYGALPAILLFSEMTPGSPYLSVNISYAWPVYAIVLAHLLTGIAARIYRAVR